MTTSRLIGSTLLAASFFPMLTMEAEASAPPADIRAAAEAAARDAEALHDLLKRYEVALNAADTRAVLRLYAPDGVFMPAFSPSAVGAPAIEAAYDAVFRAIALSVRFDVQEIVQVAPSWAFARTNSAGTVRVHATGGTAQEANQELFVLHKNDAGAWRIARYSFSPIRKPGA